jgi:hypothetical protein
LALSSEAGDLSRVDIGRECDYHGELFDNFFYEGGTTMAVYDFRMYTLKPGATPDYMAAVREVGKPVRDKYGVKLAGWYYSDVGELNQVVHIWAYRDHRTYGLWGIPASRLRIRRLCNGMKPSSSR